MSVFFVFASFSVFTITKASEGTYWFHIQPWRRRQHFTPKRLHTAWTVRCATTQNIAIFLHITLKLQIVFCINLQIFFSFCSVVLENHVRPLLRIGSCVDDCALSLLGYSTKLSSVTWDETRKSFLSKWMSNLWNDRAVAMCLLMCSTVHPSHDLTATIYRPS
jgi:hypothetical protein